MQIVSYNTEESRLPISSKLTNTLKDRIDTKALPLRSLIRPENAHVKAVGLVGACHLSRGGLGSRRLVWELLRSPLCRLDKGRSKAGLPCDMSVIVCGLGYSTLI
ncbi:hypothetical protein TNCV_4958151 [Trichonephila clavipes]|nr:hypothetical protein TNCV_4958151 [Trichonephila clavipes]